MLTYVMIPKCSKIENLSLLH